MRHSQVNPQYKIALILRETSEYVRDVVEGLTQYIRPHRSWLLRRMSPFLYNEKMLKAWGPDGIISSLGLPNLTESLGRLHNIPVIGMSDLLEKQEAHFDKVCPDDTAIARMAGDYFLDAGFKSFGFIGAKGFLFSKQRERSFSQSLARRGYAPAIIELKPTGIWGRYIGTKTNHQLKAWLTGLPRPTAIFAANDELALPINEACFQLGLRIPEDIVLLGVDNDRLLCELSWPPLSSVQVPAQRIGYEIAALLERRMSGTCTGAPVRKLLPPVGIKVRQSSDILALEDGDLADAVRFIRENAGKPIEVKDILRQVPVSRRALERRFKKVLGRSPLDEIHRVRVDRAKQILSNTDLQMPEVAQRSGLGDNNQMCAVFRKLVGMTPTQWRNQSRVQTLI